MSGDQAVLLLAIVCVLQYCLAIFLDGLSDHALCATIALHSIYLVSLAGTTVAYRLSPWHPLASFPGPWAAKASSLWLLYMSLGGQRYLLIDALHARYGPFVRIGEYLRWQRVSLRFYLTLSF